MICVYLCACVFACVWTQTQEPPSLTSSLPLPHALISGLEDAMLFHHLQHPSFTATLLSHKHTHCHPDIAFSAQPSTEEQQGTKWEHDILPFAQHQTKSWLVSAAPLLLVRVDLPINPPTRKQTTWHIIRKPINMPSFRPLRFSMIAPAIVGDVQTPIFHRISCTKLQFAIDSLCSFTSNINWHAWTRKTCRIFTLSCFRINFWFSKRRANLCVCQ